MGAFDLATSRAGAEILHVLQGLSSHLPMTLLHVRGLFLGHGPEDGIPDPRQQAGDIQGERGGSP